MSTDVPALRFAGFDASWEQRKLDEFVSFFSGLTYSPADIRPTGTLVLRSSNVKDGEVVDADNVYVDPTVVNSENVRDGDIIVVVRNGSRALIGKHAEIKGFKPNTVIGAFMTGIRSEHPSFLNALLNTPRFDKEVEMNMGATINQITGYMFSKMEFMVPSPDEQDAIGNYFKRLDNLITLHQKKVISLKKIKTILLDKMFPQDGASAPEIRFSGFTGAWERKKLKELVDYTASNLSTKDAVEKGQYDLYDANGLIGKTNHDPIEVEYITVIKDGAGVGRIRKLPKNTMFIGTMGALTSKETNLDFIFSLLTRFNLGDAYSGSTIPHIYFKDYGENLYYIPMQDEQNAIGSFFAQIDNLISLHQRNLEELKIIKNSLLERMFV